MCFISDARLAVISDYEDYCDLVVTFSRLLIKFPSGWRTQRLSRFTSWGQPACRSCMKAYPGVLIQQKWRNIRLQVGAMAFSLRQLFYVQMLQCISLIFCCMKSIISSTNQPSDVIRPLTLVLKFSVWYEWFPKSCAGEDWDIILRVGFIFQISFYFNIFCFQMPFLVHSKSKKCQNNAQYTV